MEPGPCDSFVLGRSELLRWTLSSRREDPWRSCGCRAVVLFVSEFSACSEWSMHAIGWRASSHNVVCGEHHALSESDMFMVPSDNDRR